MLTWVPVWGGFIPAVIFGEREEPKKPEITEPPKPDDLAVQRAIARVASLRPSLGWR